MKKITYEDKKYIRNDPSFPRTQTVTDEDMNEIKNAVNENADELDTAKEDIENLQKNDAQQDKSIEALQKENTELKEECSRLRQDLNAFPSGQAEGEYITLKDSADSRFNMFRVGGNSKQETREGYNLANLDSESYTAVGVTVTNNGDGSFTLNGTTNGAGDINLTKNVDINKTIYDFENADYLLKTIVESGSLSNSNNLLVQTACVGKIGETNSFELLLNQLSKNIFSQVIARNTNCHLSKIEIYIGGAGIVFNNYRIKVLLAKSNDTNLAWEPYGASPSPEFPSEIRNNVENINIINCNENLVLNGYSTDKTDKAFWKEKSAGFTPLSDGWGRFEANNSNGNSVAYVNAFISFEKFKKIINKNNAYKLLVEFRNVNMPSSSGNNYICICTGGNVEPFNETVKYNASEITQNLKFTRTLSPSKAENPTYLLRSFLAVPAGNTSSLEVRISLLEYDSTETEIKMGNQELTFPLEEGQRLMLGDYLAKDGIHHVRKQFVVDGTEKIFSVELLSTGYIRFNFYKIGCTGTYGGATTIRFCSIFKNDELKRWDILTGNANIIGIASYTDQLKLVMKNVFGITESDSLEDMTTKVSNYLKENNFTVEEVVDEYVEAYTPEQQKAYNEIVQTAKSYKNVTNIFSPDPVSPVFEVNYRKDIESMINNSLNNVNQQILNIV